MGFDSYPGRAGKTLLAVLYLCTAVCETPRSECHWLGSLFFVVACDIVRVTSSAWQQRVGAQSLGCDHNAMKFSTYSCTCSFSQAQFKWTTSKQSLSCLHSLMGKMLVLNLRWLVSLMLCISFSFLAFHLSLSLSPPALCSPRCLNGGLCMSPGVCICPPGYYGDSCDKGTVSPKSRQSSFLLIRPIEFSLSLSLQHT